MNSHEKDPHNITLQKRLAIVFAVDYQWPNLGMRKTFATRAMGRQLTFGAISTCYKLGQYDIQALELESRHDAYL